MYREHECIPGDLLSSRLPVIADFGLPASAGKLLAD
jgi:hypothetical protein